MTRLVSFAHSIRNFISNPTRVLVLCLVFITGSLVFSGNLLRLYGLHRDQGRLLDQITLVRAQIVDLDKQFKLAQDPNYIERQALDRYDLVEENDLVFVFADE